MRKNSGWKDDTESKCATLPRSISYGSDSWHAFFTKFTSYADEFNWTARQRKNNLCWSLEGKASEFYALLVEREPRLEYFDLVKRMEKRFALRDLPEASQMLFNYARQMQDESVLDWADRLLVLATRAFSDMPEHHVQKQLVLRFCQGCVDREAGQFAINMRPVSLETAVDYVRWHQHTSQAIYGKARKNVKQATREYEYNPDVGFNVKRVGVKTTFPSERSEAANSDPEALDRRFKLFEDKMDNKLTDLSNSVEKKVDDQLTNLSKSVENQMDSKLTNLSP